MRLTLSAQRLSFVPCYLLIVFAVLRCPLLPAQTILEQGDLAIIGVNANNSGCSGNPGEDLISFVCFKDIEPGTNIDVTDNGWERELPDRWGNAEGAFTATRTSGTIPAGTVITFRMPGVAGDYSAAAPDNGWNFLRRNALGQNVNLNAGGDQFYFMQGGLWDDGTSGFGFANDADYIGGRILFGFNTTQDWLAFQNTSTTSGLHPEVEACFSMQPTGTSTDYISYSGPLTPAIQLEWVSRLANPDNWTTFSSCNSYPNPPASIPISSSGISLSCAVCTACAPTTDTITFNLPVGGGPFIVEYSIGQDTFVQNGLLDGDFFIQAVDSTLRYQVLSVTDNQGCPTFSNFEGGTQTTIRTPPLAQPLAPILLCPDDRDLPIDLQDRLGDSIQGGADTLLVSFFRSSGGIDTIRPDSAFIPRQLEAIFASVRDSFCTSQLVRIPIQEASVPRVAYELAPVVCGAQCRDLSINIDADRPYTLDATLSYQTDTIRTGMLAGDSTASFIIPICQDSFSGQLAFRLSTSINLRTDSLPICRNVRTDQLDVSFPQPGFNSVQRLLCEGESLEINGVVYNEQRPNGSQTLPNAAQNGCDSIIQVNLLFAPAISGNLIGDTSLCPGEGAELQLQLFGASQYQALIVSDRGDSISTFVDGGTARIPVNPPLTTTYRLASIIAEGTNCRDTPDATAQVQVSDLQMRAEQAIAYGGFGVSCQGAQDGSVRVVASVANNLQPLTFFWNTGAVDSVLRNLPAGSYSVNVMDAIGCERSASIDLLEPDSLQVSFTPQSALCPGDTPGLLLSDVSGGAGPYRYTMGDRTNFQAINSLPVRLSDLEAGPYTLLVEDFNGCSFERSFVLSAADRLQIDLGEDQFLRIGDSAQINAVLNFTPVALRWSPAGSLQLNADSLQACTGPLQRTTIYSLTARTGDGCSISEQVRLFVQDDREIFAPNAFSPNQDAINDVFRLTGDPTVVQEIITLQVYDRWGNLLYRAESLDPLNEEAGWNGRTVNGELLPSGTYVYRAEVLLSNGDRRVMQGDVLLLR